MDKKKVLSACMTTEKMLYTAICERAHRRVVTKIKQTNNYVNSVSIVPSLT